MWEADCWMPVSHFKAGNVKLQSEQLFSLERQKKTRSLPLEALSLSDR